MKEINGHKYSTTFFEDYKYRAKFKFSEWKKGTIKMVDSSDRSVDLYTTDSDKERVKTFLQENAKVEILNLSIVGWSTKEQDDLTTELIEEALKNL